MAAWEFPLSARPRVTAPKFDVLMLAEAQLCEDCTAITRAPFGACERCGSESLLALRGVLNRETGAQARKEEKH